MTQPFQYPVRIERNSPEGIHLELVVATNRVVIAETLLRMLNETDGTEIKVSYSKCSCEDPVNNCEWPGFHHHNITGKIEL